MRKSRMLLAATVATSMALVLGACGAPESSPTDGAPSGDEALLGGPEAVAALDELYEAAVEAGQTEITIYGPGETDKQSMYDDIFSARYPEISVTGVYILGPDYTAKMEAEFASGQHVADIVQTGDTAMVPGLTNDWFEPFEPVTAATIDAGAYSDESGAVWAASASTFGFMYNTNELSADEAPQGWEDLLDPSLKGRMTSDTVTRNGAGFGTLSHILWDGRYGEELIEGLGQQEITLQQSAPVAGNAVATGEFAVEPWYVYSFYLANKAQGAPVDFVFPTEGGVHISPHYLAVVEGANNPDAAKLLMTWLFTPEAQQAQAALGYYPLVPGQPGPEGAPPVEELDLFKPFNLNNVGQVMGENLGIVKAAFGG